MLNFHRVPYADFCFLPHHPLKEGVVCHLLVWFCGCCSVSNEIDVD